MIPCAYLRVFRPLETYPDGERSHWERYILSGGAPPALRPVYRDESRKGRWIGLLSSAEGEYAEVRLVNGRYYVCPWRTRLRILASILSLRESAPPDLAEALVSDVDAKRVARELARMKRREPSAVPSMLQSPWHVPIRWFALVSDDERHLAQSSALDGRYRLFYWTPLEQARRRADHALRVLRRTELAPLVQLIKQMADWLAAFHSASVVELDYASVSSLFSWDELDDDHSGRDVQEAIQAVSARELSRAAELYQSVASRWAEAMSRESLN